MSPRAAAIAAVTTLVVTAAILLVVVVPRYYAPTATVTPPAARPAPVAEPKITATLYYISEDGLSLVGAKREVVFGEGTAEQARRIVEAQLTDAPAPLASAIPAGTTLRSVFVSERGDAFVDLSAEVATKHGGGALDELFTVYAVVNALTVNLPAISRVQILVNGKEVDTIAGHVDVRHPLQKNLKWVQGAE